MHVLCDKLQHTYSFYHPFLKEEGDGKQCCLLWDLPHSNYQPGLWLKKCEKIRSNLSGIKRWLPHYFISNARLANGGAEKKSVEIIRWWQCCCPHRKRFDCGKNYAINSKLIPSFMKFVRGHLMRHKKKHGQTRRFFARFSI